MILEVHQYDLTLISCFSDRSVSLNYLDMIRRPGYVSTRTFRRCYASVASHQIYDVVIVGGGIAGLSLATALEQDALTSQALRVALIEGNDLTPVRDWKLDSKHFSNRVSSLTPSSRAFFDRLGVWGHIDHSRVKDYHDMQVWDGVSGARISFDSEGAIATMVENLHLQKALLKSITSTTIYEKARVESIDRQEGSEGAFNEAWPLIRLDTGQTLSARLLVGADGTNSPVRSFAKIESAGWDYNTHAVVATLELDPTHANETAWQRFLPTGPIALLPLPGPYASLVWSTTTALAKALRGVPADMFPLAVNAALRLPLSDLSYMYDAVQSGQDFASVSKDLEWRHNIASGHALEAFSGTTTTTPPRVVSVQDKTRAGFPLKMRHADRYVAERLALAGDAAHTIHPLAGQGLNLGIADVESLAKSISFAVRHGGDVGSTVQCLDMYARDRYSANNTMLGVVDKLHKLYTSGSNSNLVVWARTLGLRTVDALGPLVKKAIMGRAGSVQM